MDSRPPQLERQDAMADIHSGSGERHRHGNKRPDAAWRQDPDSDARVSSISHDSGGQQPTGGAQSAQGVGRRLFLQDGLRKPGEKHRGLQDDDIVQPSQSCGHTVGQGHTGTTGTNMPQPWRHRGERRDSCRPGSLRSQAHSVCHSKQGGGRDKHHAAGAYQDVQHGWHRQLVRHRTQHATAPAPLPLDGSQRTERTSHLCAHSHHSGLQPR